MISRFLQSLCLLLLGAMIYYLHLDMLKLNDSITKVAEQARNLKIEPQRAILRIDKPKVPAIKYLPKKQSTMIDELCNKH